MLKADNILCYTKFQDYSSSYSHFLRDCQCYFTSSAIVKAARPRRTKRTEKRRLLKQNFIFNLLYLSILPMGIRDNNLCFSFSFVLSTGIRKRSLQEESPMFFFLGKWNEKKSHCITIKISNSTQKVSSSSKIFNIVNLEVIMVLDLVMVKWEV